MFAKHYYIFPVLILILSILYLSISPLCKSFKIHLLFNHSCENVQFACNIIFFSHFYILVHTENVSIHIFVMVGFITFSKAQKYFYHPTMLCVCKLDLRGLSLYCVPDNKIKV